MLTYKEITLNLIRVQFINIIKYLCKMPLRKVDRRCSREYEFFTKSEVFARTQRFFAHIVKF